MNRNFQDNDRHNGIEFPGEGSIGIPSELTQVRLAQVKNTAFNNAGIFLFKLQSAMSFEHRME